MNTHIPISSASVIEQRIPKRAPFFALSRSFAPRFCPMNVVRAIEKLVIGRKAKPSILLYAPLPATAEDEKVFMFVCTIVFAKPMTEFCIPEGRP